MKKLSLLIYFAGVIGLSVGLGLCCFGYTVSGSTYTTSGAQTDVQAACNAAPDNGTVTVLIPNGTYNWTGQLTITKSVTLAGASATGVTIQNGLASGVMMSVTSSANGHVNIYWLNILQVADNGGGAGYAVSLNRTEPSSYTVLVHDCSFKSGTTFGYTVNVQANGIIFWNDTFVGDGPDTNALGGVNFTCGKYGQTSSWNTADTYGALDTTGLGNSYLENCQFYDAPSSCTNFDDNTRVVARNCTISNASFMSHGQETSPYGVRQIEIYNCSFVYNTSGTGPSGTTYPMNMNDWMIWRGGSGAMFGNAIQDIPNKTGINFAVFSITRGGQIACQTAYPAARQVGQGWSASSTATYGTPVVTQDGTGAVTEGVWIWGNTGTETADPSFIGLNPDSSDSCGNGQLVANYVKVNRDYFLSAKPGYTPYQYPHPLHTQYAIPNGSPTPTPSPTATASPTATSTPTTPSPSPTPTSTPTSSPSPTPSPTPYSQTITIKSSAPITVTVSPAPSASAKKKN
jgi:hypothetical protein